MAAANGEQAVNSISAPWILSIINLKRDFIFVAKFIRVRKWLEIVDYSFNELRISYFIAFPVVTLKNNVTLTLYIAPDFEMKIEKYFTKKIK